MSDTTTETLDHATTEPANESTATTAGVENAESGVSFSERYSEIIGKVNQTLDQVDWNQMGRIGKATGIIVAVIVAQILIKGVLDTINLLPIVPGLLELLGLVVVGQWSWNNLTTSEKRSGVVARIQNLRKEYLG
ncbi:CAAD domain-containing protein [Synechococcus sp. FGCU-3]|jgi:CAAD domains of cyanobacterial aminoacyl-tRNA synthetase|nr:CAAD domain-containing protein [Synechococcus sp. FGCU3]